MDTASSNIDITQNLQPDNADFSPPEQSQPQNPLPIGIARLKARLKTCLSQLDDNVHFLNILRAKRDQDESEILELEFRLSQVKPLLDQIIDIQIQVETCGCNIAGDTVQKFRSDYYFFIGQATKIVKNFNEMFTHQSTSNSNPVSVKPKLPAIEVCKFDGEIRNWLTFRDSFEAMLKEYEGIRDVHKLQLLKKAIVGKAASILDNLPVENDNFKVAWKLLSDRFENKQLLVNNHLKAIMDFPSIKQENPVELRKLHDNLTRNLRALQNLNLPVNFWDAMLVFIVTEKLDDKTKRALGEYKTSKTELLSYEELDEFLDNHCTLLEQFSANTNKQPKTASKLQEQKSSKPRPSPAGVSNVATSTQCQSCNENHPLFLCDQFVALPVKSRIEFCTQNKLCKNCLRPNHNTLSCKSIHKCKTCQKQHHTLLHLNTPETNSNPDPAPGGEVTNTTNLCEYNNSKCEVLLSTALVQVTAQSDTKYIHARCLLDSGSQNNFVTQEICQQLNIEIKAASVNTILGIGGKTTPIIGQVILKVRSGDNKFTFTLSALVLPNITGHLPTTSIPINRLDLPTEIQLADPQFNVPAQIDMLIGAYHFFELLSIGQIRLSNKAIAQKTKLGWVLSGPVKIPRKFSTEQTSISNLSTNSHSVESTFEPNVSKLWIIDEPIKTPPTLSTEETICEGIFQNTHRRDNSGRFVVQIPLKTEASELGDSRHQALSRLQLLERKLNKNSSLREDYNKFMTEYIHLGHMVQVDDTVESPPCFYLPHHAVLRTSSLTTKLRVVFDGSAKTDSGISLNDLQYVGPTLQPDLFFILLKFRQHAYVLTADIEKMYRMILIDPSQTSLQRILWRSSTEEPIQTFELQTVTYGLASSPYLAVKCLMQLAEDNSTNHPRASEVIKSDFYMDDLITGASSKEELCKLQSELSDILFSAGFNLRKYLSNSPEVLKNIDQSNVSENCSILNLSQDENAKLLGINWNATSDVIEFSIEPDTTKSRVSKRTILSTISRIFDPLGFIGPIIVSVKILLQKLWILKLDWDESLPQNLHTQWLNLKAQLPILNKLKIHRHVSQLNADYIQVHGFSDASEQAYGCCVYLRSVKTDKIVVRLLCAKSRVAPIKKISLPRLELCAALLLSRLLDQIMPYIVTQPIIGVYYWTDSTITLNWIQSPSNHRTTFVANRVSEIQSSSSIENWRHVRSEDNPADLISRGVLPSTIISSTIWFSGPQWLSFNEDQWPVSTCFNPKPSELLPETKKSVFVATNAVILNQSEIFTKYSSFSKLRQVVGYCLRFIKNCGAAKSGHARKTSKSLSVEELNASSKVLLKLAQGESFQEELKSLRNQQPLNTSSSIRNLNPFLDRNDIIRVGGRLEQSEFPFDKKHPILLSHKHILSKLIVREEHIKQLHSGPQTLLHFIREKYWPTSGKNLTKQIVRECVICTKAKPRIVNPIMGNLPSSRLNIAFAFAETGLDYAGPFKIRDRYTRNPKEYKCYVCLFICLSTKAIHLEAVTSLTTKSFLACFRRFIARRGKPKILHSDNATNFQGAEAELTDLYTFFRSNSEELAASLASDEITWKFIPPRSPHFGGIWEAGVKSVKFHLKRVLANAYLNYEEFYSVLVQIEGILNSRPLSTLSTDPNDLNPLTPSHFLIGRPAISLPDNDLMDVNSNRLNRYQLCQQLVQHFWKRWSREYINGLQTRAKWTKPNQPNIKQGDLVLVKEDGFIPQWKLGRVLELHPGKDGVARVATIKFPTGLAKRPIHKLCLIPATVEQK